MMIFSNKRRKLGLIEGVTAVLTSCQRYDLLKETLNSFATFNSFDIHELILVEDGRFPSDIIDEFQYDFPIKIISTGQRVGQIAAIDYAYSHVNTEFIFHMEDDWEFYRSNFIEKSLAVLADQRKCLQVWLRALDDTMGHPISRKTQYTDGIAWRKLEYNYDKLWHGFAFNPGLRRMIDYIDINGYGINTLGHPQWTDELGNRESILGKLYRDKGMFAVILSDESGRGYTRHLGWNRHVIDKPVEIKTS